MPLPRKATRVLPTRNNYPFGSGDGSKKAQVRASGIADARDQVNDANELNDAAARGSEKGGDDANGVGNDGGAGIGDGDNNDRGVYAPGDGGVDADQIINILPDQTIRVVVASPEVKKDSTIEHPQDRVERFWSNFEPEYLGGVTQILPDAVAESTITASKKPTETTAKAVRSYEVARASCIKSVKRIIRECRSNNQKYTDLHFDLERDLKVTGDRNCLYGLESFDGAKNPGDVKRVTDVFEAPEFFKDGAGFDDIVQGALGDCWFLAALSAITANPELLRKVCVIQDQDVGVYGFVFHRDGEWHPCFIDDKLYLRAPSFDESGEIVLEQYGVKQKEMEKVYMETQQRGSKALFFASCRDDNETWVPLLEKAFAKAHGDFTALDGGQVGEALEDLTGGITTEIYTTNILNKDVYWRDLCRIGKDFIFSCHVSIYSGWRLEGEYEQSVRDRRLKGIVESHAYSVLATYEGYGQRLVKVRNPWGEREWNGAWSDGSKEWTADWLNRLDHKFGDDGVFWMSYEDMLRRYKYMDRTRLFGPEWYIVQEWTSVQVPWNSRDYQTTTFSLEVSEDTEAVIALSQLDDRYFRGFDGPYGFTLSFRVQKIGEDEDEDEDDYFARSPINYELSRSTNVEVQLEKGSYTVLFKVEATKYTTKDIETVIRDNAWRREKLTQMATLYDLAFRKGRPPPSEKKVEEVEETKAEELITKLPPQQNDSQNKTNGETKKDTTNGKIEETEEKSEETKEKSEETKEKSEETTATDGKQEEKVEQKQEGKQPQYESSDPPAVMASQGVDSQLPAPQKAVPNANDPNRNPWNAFCVLGLRVYSKLPDLQLKVARPGDKPAGVVLDRDDIAKAAQAEAENAQDKQQSQ